MSEAWPMVRFGEVLTERQEVPSTDALANGDIRIVAKIGFNDGKIQLRSGSETKTGMILVRPGDLLISGINAAKGAIAIYGEENTEPIAATIHYGAYMPNKARVNVKYLWWLLRSGTFRDLLYTYVPGGIKTELKAKRLLPIPVPLPSIEEQRRIVARIDELASKIQNAHNLREQAAKETEALVNNQLRVAFSSFANRHGTASLGDLIIKAGYGSSEKCDSERIEGAVPVLRIPNVVSEQITLADLKYAHLSARDQERLILSKGDILVVRTNGSLDLVGRSAVVDDLPEPMAFASYMIRLRFDQERILPEYAQRTLQHLRMAGQLVDLARTTAGQYNVSLGRLRSARIPVPTLSEQHGIVGKLDTLLAEVEVLNHLQAETIIKLDALLPSILDKAFKGEL